MNFDSIYCDRLTFRSTTALFVHRLRRTVRSGATIEVLDGPPKGRRTRLYMAALAAVGLSVREAAFFVGHMFTSDGEGLGPAVAKEAMHLAKRTADALILQSPVLLEINTRWGRECVRLRLAKQSWWPTLELLSHVRVAEHLSASSGRALLLCGWPAGLPRTLLREIPSTVDIQVTSTLQVNWKLGRWSPILWALREQVHRWRRPRPAPPAVDDSLPALLVLQEDDLSFDRAHRGQPHWLDGHSTPSFRTIVLRTSRVLDVRLTEEERRTSGVEVVDLAELSYGRDTTDLGRDLTAAFWRLAWRALWTRSASEAASSAEIARMLLAARGLARFCSRRGVSAFLTCENYMLHADAMQVVAAPLNIRSLSYQYSNMPNPSLLMVATADEMITFSPMFHSRFSWPGFPAPKFHDAGYVFSSSFELVKPAAAACRARLSAAGASFVIGFFDESVQQYKYGWIGREDYEKEFVLLLEAVLEDPSLGLVTKTQFQHNQALLSARAKSILAAATATGRFEQRSHGKHRNVVFPSEVAAASDVTIGHLFGGTAALESALAGCRSLMLNTQQVRSLAASAYGQTPIVFPSLADALRAIREFRDGSPQWARLGDWSPSLSQFDPFHDGRSAERFRSIVTEAVLSGRPADVGSPE